LAGQPQAHRQHDPLSCLPAGKDGQPVASKYDLAANIVHEGKAGAGQGLYRVHIQRKASSAAV
jgi:U4/U6.U5 tri-snRNP-associated protein 2